MVIKKNILHSIAAGQRSRLLGDIVFLMTISESHAQYKIQHLSSVVFPALALGQYRIYHDAKKNPVGFVSWAMLSAEAEQKLLNHAAPLTPEEWASGDIIYIMEFIAPFGHAQKISKDMKQHLAGRKAHAIRHDSKGGKMVTTFYGDGDENL